LGQLLQKAIPASSADKVFPSFTRASAKVKNQFNSFHMKLRILLRHPWVGGRERKEGVIGGESLPIRVDGIQQQCFTRLS